MSVPEVKTALFPASTSSSTASVPPAYSVAFRPASTLPPTVASPVDARSSTSVPPWTVLPEATVSVPFVAMART